jgi:excisionase family DNA binding protein
MAPFIGSLQATKGHLSMKSPETGERLVYTIAEVGELLGLTRNTAYEAAKRGDFPTIRVGKLIRVPKVALHAMMNQAAKAS